MEALYFQTSWGIHFTNLSLQIIKKLRLQGGSQAKMHDKAVMRTIVFCSNGCGQTPRSPSQFWVEKPAGGGLPSHPGGHTLSLSVVKEVLTWLYLFSFFPKMHKKGSLVSKPCQTHRENQIVKKKEHQEKMQRCLIQGREEIDFCFPLHGLSILHLLWSSNTYSYGPCQCSQSLPASETDTFL
jgi:hypothetical protein